MREFPKDPKNWPEGITKPDGLWLCEETETPWIEVNKTWGSTEADNYEYEGWKYEVDLRPAMQLVLRNSDDKERTVLVGDINPNGGRCDCCSDIESNEIVVRYRQLSL